MAEKTKKIQPYKIEAVNKIKEMIQSSKNLIFADFRGLDIAQITELRGQLRESDTEFRVIKNNYAKLAISELGLPAADEFLIDPTALTLIGKDYSQAAGVLIKFARNSTLKVKGGLIDGNIFSAEQVAELSRLPGKEQLIAMVMSAANAPLINLMYALQGVPLKLVRTLKAVAEKA